MLGGPATSVIRKRGEIVMDFKGSIIMAVLQRENAIVEQETKSCVT